MWQRLSSDPDRQVTVAEFVGHTAVENDIAEPAPSNDYATVCSAETAVGSMDSIVDRHVPRHASGRAVCRPGRRAHGGHGKRDQRIRRTNGRADGASHCHVEASSRGRGREPSVALADPVLGGEDRGAQEEGHRIAPRGRPDPHMSNGRGSESQPFTSVRSGDRLT